MEFWLVAGPVGVRDRSRRRDFYIVQRSSQRLVVSLATAAAGKPAGALEFAVYSILLSHANPEQVCWLKMSTIAQEAGVSESTARRALRALESWGLIEIEEQIIAGVGQRSSVYTLIDPEVPVDTSNRPSDAASHRQTGVSERHPGGVSERRNRGVRETAPTNEINETCFNETVQPQKAEQEDAVSRARRRVRLGNALPEDVAALLADEWGRTFIRIELRKAEGERRLGAHREQIEEAGIQWSSS